MLQLARLLPPEERLSHIVVMGMGEPLANLDALLAALAEATSPSGLGISPRRITISTVGLPPAMRRLAELDARYQLAVSLHAPNDELRNQLVPVNKNIGLAAIVDAADQYFRGFRPAADVRVRAVGRAERSAGACAAACRNCLRGRLALLNVIPYNPVAGLPYKTPIAKGARAVPGNPGASGHQRSGPRAEGGRDQRRLRPASAAFERAGCATGVAGRRRRPPLNSAGHLAQFFRGFKLACGGTCLPRRCLRRIGGDGADWT